MARRALIIGNWAYDPPADLDNPKHDCIGMAGALEKVGFERPTVRENLNLVELAREVREFTKSLTEADVAVFHYSGHAVQLAGENHLVAVGVTLEEPQDVPHGAFSLAKAVDGFRAAAGTTIVFLDACRDNPFLEGHEDADGKQRRLVPKKKGLATNTDKTRGSVLTVFAAEAGRTAADGKRGGMSPFTRALVDLLPTPGLEVTNLVRRVAKRVRDETGHEQAPTMSGVLDHEFRFVEGESGVETAGKKPPAPLTPGPAPGNEVGPKTSSGVERARDSGEPFPAHLYTPVGPFDHVKRAWVVLALCVVAVLAVALIVPPPTQPPRVAPNPPRSSPGLSFSEKYMQAIVDLTSLDSNNADERSAARARLSSFIAAPSGDPDEKRRLALALARMVSLPSRRGLDTPEARIAALELLLRFDRQVWIDADWREVRSTVRRAIADMDIDAAAGTTNIGDATRAVIDRLKPVVGIGTMQPRISVLVAQRTDADGPSSTLSIGTALERLQPLMWNFRSDNRLGNVFVPRRQDSIIRYRPSIDPLILRDLASDMIAAGIGRVFDTRAEDLGVPDIDIEVVIYNDDTPAASATQTIVFAWCYQQPVSGTTTLFRAQCFQDKRICVSSRISFIQSISISGTCGFVPSLREAGLSRLEWDAGRNVWAQGNPTPFRWPIPPLPPTMSR